MPRTLMVDSRKDFVHHSWGSLEHRLQLQSDSEISRNVAYLTTMIRASKAQVDLAMDLTVGSDLHSLMQNT